MNVSKKWIGVALAAVPLLVIGSLVAANSQTQPENRSAQATADGFICPVTGEELPCPKCCVLNRAQPEQTQPE
jgi:hypothetical protein